MTMNESLRTSKYLHIIPRGEDFAVYHSLLGGLCTVDADSASLFNIFRIPRSTSEVRTIAPRFSGRQIQSFIAAFRPRRFLVNPDFNEYDVIQKKIDKTRRHLHEGSQIGVIQLIVTNNCNFRCNYCFINKIYSSEKRFVSQASASNKVMSPETAQTAIENVIKILKKNKRNTLGIQFFGGEPLLNWKTIKFVLEHFDRGDNYGIEINYSIVTNGSLFTPEMVTCFLRYNIPIVISFDSPQGKERLLSNGKGTLKEIRKGLTLLKRSGNRVVFNSVFSEQTFDFFDTSLVDFALEHGVYEIGVLMDLDLKFYERKAVDIVDRLWGVYTYGKSKGIVVTGYWHIIFQKMIAYDHFRHDSFKTCSATGCQLSIEPSGDVFACKASSGYFGHISEIDALLSSDAYKEYAMRAFRNATECSGCEIEGFCSGLCLGSLEKWHRTIHTVEKKTCKIYRELTRILILDIRKEGIENYHTVMK